MQLMTKRSTTAARTVKTWARGSLDRKGPRPSKTIATHFSPSKEAKVASRPRIIKSLRRNVCAKGAPRLVDFLAIFVAGVASIAIIINAVFLQSDRGTYEPEPLLSKLQKTHDSLKSERERLQQKIDNVPTRN
jgi:hypothetical protein